MFKRMCAEVLNFYREQFNQRYGKCEILVALQDGDPLQPYAMASNKNLIILNIGQNAVRNYGADEDQIWFDGRYSGKVVSAVVRYSQVVGVRDQSFTGKFDTGEWILIHTEDDIREFQKEPAATPNAPPEPPKPRPGLKVVK